MLLQPHGWLWVVDSVQGWVGLKDSVPWLLGVGTQICCDVDYWLHRSERAPSWGWTASESDHGKGVAKILKPRLETSTVEVEEGLLAMVCRFIQTRIRENVLIVAETTRRKAGGVPISCSGTLAGCEKVPGLSS